MTELQRRQTLTRERTSLKLEMGAVGILQRHQILPEVHVSLVVGSPSHLKTFQIIFSHEAGAAQDNVVFSRNKTARELLGCLKKFLGYCWGTERSLEIATKNMHWLVTMWMMVC